MTTLAIYYGASKPRRAVGAHQCRLLAFAEKYRGWHTHAADRTTARAIAGLIRRGAIEASANNQFRWPV